MPVKERVALVHLPGVAALVGATFRVLFTPGIFVLCSSAAFDLYFRGSSIDFPSKGIGNWRHDFSTHFEIFTSHQNYYSLASLPHVVRRADIVSVLVLRVYKNLLRTPIGKIN